MPKNGAQAKKPTSKEKLAATTALTAAAAVPANHCVWSDNNAACVNTWMCLKNILGQISADFYHAESIPVSQFAFWNAVSGAANRAIEAAAIADLMTKIFTRTLRATYEPGQNYASALLAMQEILTDGDKTVCELAAVVDEQHRFLVGETI